MSVVYQDAGICPAIAGVQAMSNITIKSASERPTSVVSQVEMNRAMSLGISFNGTQFVCQEFKYDKLPDAISYAELITARDGVLPSVSCAADWLERNVPNEADKVLMEKYGICFEDWRYKYQDYRYDRLADAVNYASTHNTVPLGVQ